MKFFQHYVSKVDINKLKKIGSATELNHAYFMVSSGTILDKDELYEKIENDNICLEIIDNMIFDVGVQSFSNVNKIATFRVDTTKPKSKQV